jgi:biotin carboxyl carrier protein
MALVEVKVPDIGDFDEVAVIELLVKVGDTVKAEQSLITVESDKASMEIPSSTAGVVKELRVALGDKVKEGSVVLVVEAAGEAAAPAPAAAPAAAPAPAPVAAPAAAAAPVAAPAASGPVQVFVPDIGDFKDVAVIEVFVKPGDTIKVEQSLITVESDKASMEIPSSHAGVLKELKVKVGDTVNIGDCWPSWTVWLSLPVPLLFRRPLRLLPPRRWPRLLHPALGRRLLLQWLRLLMHLAALPWAFPTPLPLCASSPVNWACLWRRSRAAVPRVVLRRTMCKPSLRPSCRVLPRHGRRPPRHRRVVVAPNWA